MNHSIKFLFISFLFVAPNAVNAMGRFKTLGSRFYQKAVKTAATFTQQAGKPILLQNAKQYKKIAGLGSMSMATTYFFMQRTETPVKSTVQPVVQTPTAQEIKNSLYAHTKKYEGAFILPYYKDGDAYYLILAREGFGRETGNWSLFGGGTEDEDQRDVIATAAREFYEEALAKKTLSTNAAELYHKLDPVDPLCTTHAIVVHPRTAIFLTEFDAASMHNLLQTFHAARAAQEKKWRKNPSLANFKYIEIDGIASVRLSDLAYALAHKKTSMQALVMGKNQTAYTETIPLRSLINDTLKDFADKGGLAALSSAKPQIQLHVQHKV